MADQAKWVAFKKEGFPSRTYTERGDFTFMSDSAIWDPTSQQVQVTIASSDLEDKKNQGKLDFFRADINRVAVQKPAPEKLVSFDVAGIPQEKRNSKRCPCGYTRFFFIVGLFVCSRRYVLSTFDNR